MIVQFPNHLGVVLNFPRVVFALFGSAKRSNLCVLPQFLSENRILFFGKISRKIRIWLDREEAYGTRFLFLPVFIGAGAISYFQLDFEPTLAKMLAFIMLCALLILVLRFSRILRLVGVMVLVLSLGGLFAKMETVRLGTDFIPHAMIVPITARILSWEEQSTGTHRLFVRIITAQRGEEFLKDKKIRLTARSLPDDVQIGTGLSGLVSLRPPSGPVRAGAYDFGFHTYYQGVGAQGFFMGQPERTELSAPTNLLERLDIILTGLRTKLDQRIKTSIEGEAGAIASALVTGQRGLIGEETNQALRLSGLAHILSISGLHMAMATGMVLLMVRAFLGLFIHFSSHFAPRKIAACLALIFSGFYLLLSGAQIAAQRSFIMVAIMLMAVLFDRNAMTMRNLSLAALVILTLTPHEILSPGFQMSFAATAALIAIFGCWMRRQAYKVKLEKNGLFWRFILLPTFSTLVASLVAGSASGVYAAYHFANVAPLGLVSNIVALPLMSLIIMPAALLACIFMPLGLESLPLSIMGIGIEGVKNISFWVANRSPDIQPAMMTQTVLLLFSLALVILLFMQSSLRLLALCPFIIGLIIYMKTPMPLVLIDEESRLIAVRTASGKLALSHSRPNAFILNNWLPVFNQKIDNILVLEQDENGFSCMGSICRAKMSDGKILAVALSKSARADACRTGDFVLLNYISFEGETCGENILTLNLRDLATQGAAMIYRQAGDYYHIKWAQGASLRPWNAHRYRSKAAIGIP